MNKSRQKAAGQPEIDHSPVTFPPGSFDHQTLSDGLDEIAAGNPDDRDSAIAELLTRENMTKVDVPDTNTVPGYKTIEVERQLVPGGTEYLGEGELAGAVKITESVQVFDPDAAGDSAEAQDSAPAPVEPTTASE